jgi:uncharacterized protein
LASRLLIDRRDFVKAAGLAFLGGLAPKAAFALSEADAVYASGFRAPDGSFGIATISERGEIIDRSRLPDRGHGLAYSPAANRIAVFARRPGTYIMVIDRAMRRKPSVITSVANRHFYGHGAFSPDGRFLYASENDFANARGMIGVYDGNEGYRRVAEYQTYGIGPHDLTVTPDGRTLIVANGGIETHPDFGRTKLNLDHMEPSITLVDASDGRLIEKHGLPRQLAQLSTRHLAIAGDGRIWFACQYEGPRNDLPPLAGFLNKGEPLTFVDLPDETTVALANYVGAIAVNDRDGLVGLTSPKGGKLVSIDQATGQVVAETDIPDAAGIADATHGFAASSYSGQLAETRSRVNWDQHLVRVKVAGAG